MRDHTKLQVWHRAHRWALAVHGESRGFPSSERYELGQQLRRAAFSVPTNIAEGAAFDSRRQYGHHLAIAAASATEAAYLLHACSDLGYLHTASAMGLEREAMELRSMLQALRQRILSNSSPSAG